MKYFEIKGDDSRRAAESFITARSDIASPDLQEKTDATRKIVQAVREKGDDAVAEFTERFDRVTLNPNQFELTQGDLEKARASVDPKLIDILQRAQDNIRRFHEKGLRQSWEELDEDGTVLGQRISPIESAGVYVPGGKAFYPSSVLMNIVPAKVAGVEEIIMVSPPSYEGTVHPVVLAAAHLAGATRVFRIGGAQAIASLAYGTETIPQVTKITGPGNTFVTAAKALVRSVADIDSEAGPSEVVVLADENANPAFVAAEMLAQAEHDEEAAAVLITTSRALVEAVEDRLSDETAKLPRKEIIKKSLQAQGAAIVTRDLNEAIALTNLFAPEHLSIQVDDIDATADKITHAGAMMLGPMTPVAVGDYFAGPNHILPTNRRARFSSPLTAEDFRKVTSILQYSEQRLKKEAGSIMTFAETENLQAHARSIEVRL